MSKRSLSEIASEIQKNWKNMYFGARPYVSAMLRLNAISDNFESDTGESVVRYFLANAGRWRGETAKRVKAELNALLK